MSSARGGRALLVLGVLGVLGVSGLGSQAALAKESSVVVDEALKKDLMTLRDAQIFFGHQSVGRNILDGVAALSREAGIELKLGEASIGENQKPGSKFEAWARRAEQGGTEQLFAMKLCYVDILQETNGDAVLADYQRAVARVRQARPGVKILHITTPLTTPGTGLKNWLKRSLGRSLWEDQVNARRLAYNRALREAFPGEPFFDLAAVESTRPDGSREEHVVDGKPVPMLWPGYASDEGHLNAEGQRVAARAFIAALAQALRQ